MPLLALLVGGLPWACDSGPGGAAPEQGGAEAVPATPEPPALFEAVDVDFGEVLCGREGGRTILEVNGGGLALFDGDGDGDLDVLIVDPGPYPAADVTAGGRNRLYRNDGDWSFVDVTAGSGVDVPGFCNGVAVGDVDGDGDRDLYLTRLGPNALLLNQGELRFEPVVGAAGAAGDGWSTSAVFVDGDRDGDPDLYVVDYLAFDPDDPPLHGRDGRQCLWKGQQVMCGPQGLEAQADHYYRNEGGRFVDVSAEAGVTVRPSYGLGVLDGDFDGDGWPDLYVSNDSMPNFLFLNQGDGTYLESGLLSGAGVSSRGREQAGMGLAAADVDGDRDEDLLVTNFSMEPNALYLNQGGGDFRDESEPAGVGGPSLPLLGWGAAFLDADLDGDPDLVNANGHVYPQADAEGTDTSYAQPDVLLLNDGDGRFRRQAWVGEQELVSRTLAAGDLDDDGRTDLVILQRSGRPQVYRGVAPGDVVQVRLVGPPGNPDGVGCTLTLQDERGERVARVRAGAGYQAVGDPRVVFAWGGPGLIDVTPPGGEPMTWPVTAPGLLTLELR